MTRFPRVFIFIFLCAFLLHLDSFGQTEEQFKELKKAELSYKNGAYGEALKTYLPLLEALDENTITQNNINYKV